MYITIDHVTKNFRKKPGALGDLTIDLPSGMIGLLGSNGAGKTTLMRILCGIIQPTNGRVLVDGHDLSDPSARRALKRVLGYLPQDIEPYPNLNPVEFLDYIGLLKGIPDSSAAQEAGQRAYRTRRVGRRAETKDWRLLWGHASSCRYRPGAHGRPSPPRRRRTDSGSGPRGTSALPHTAGKSR